MNKNNFKNLYVGLSQNFNTKPNKEVFEMWHEELEEFDLKYIKQVFRKLMMQNKYMPTLKEVIDELKNVKYEPLTEEEKIEKLKNEGIFIKLVDKEIKNESMTKEELEEFEDLLKEFKNE